MSMENQDYKNTALRALKNRWAPAVLASIVMILITSAIVGATDYKLFTQPLGMPAPFNPKGSLLRTIIFMFVFAPLTIGFANAFKEFVNNADDNVLRNVFRIGFAKWLHNVWTYFLMSLFITLWMFLLIIPGLIKIFSYAMTPFIVVDHPELSANECIDLSRKMMKGRKFDLFYLCLSFIGWFILCIFSLGIGFFWLYPYMEASIVAFYNDVKAPYEPTPEEPAPAPVPSAPESYQPQSE